MNVAQSLGAESSPPTSHTDVSALLGVLTRQRTSFLRQGPPSAEIRLDRLDRAIALLVDNKDRIAAALSEDFGHRSIEQSLFTDVASSIEPLKFAKKHLRNWMRPERRRPQAPFGLLRAKAQVHYQPLGVIGVISPWNFPVNLTFGPLAGILAAGNRAMIKPSELTPATSQLMGEMLHSAFDEAEVHVVTGGPEVGEAFSSLPFDHLLFTGGTQIAYHVMKGAAKNLVPVTLELGGKSPVVVSATANLTEVAIKVVTGKMLNAGQICLAPDYVFAPQSQVEPLVEALAVAAERLYPTLLNNPDFTSIINRRHYERLQSYVQQARDSGATVRIVNPANENFEVQEGTHKMPLHIITGADDDSAVMTKEIFGPLLPVRPYSNLDEVIEYVNSHPRPLALYYFGNDRAEQERLLRRTTSGGVTVNDVIMHVAMEDLPFGGVGPSGMGSYHGRDGFRSFSHAKAVYQQASLFDLGRFLRPPYGAGIRRLLLQQIKK